MGARVIYVSGNKGGVGKSVTSIGLVDYLLNNQSPCRIIETDTGTPDAALILKDEVKCDALDTTEEAAWHKLLHICEENKDESIIINAGARDNVVALQKWGKDYLEAIAKAIGKDLITLWVISSGEERDGLTSLREYLSLMSNRTYAVECEAKGKLTMYEASKARSAVEATGGTLLTFPAWSKMCVDKMKNERMSPARIIERGNVLEKIATEKWRERVGEFARLVK